MVQLGKLTRRRFLNNNRNQSATFWLATRVMTDWKPTVKAVAVGALSGTAIGLLAFFFLHSGQIQGMGTVLFLVVPVVAGFSVALVAGRPNTAAAATVLAVLGSLAFLVATGTEGILCAILALPIIAAGLAIGALVGLLVRRILIERTSNPTINAGMLLLVGPLLIITGKRLEKPVLERARTEVIVNSVEVHAPPEHVWLQIQTVESVQTNKPLLMYIGLPIPQRCTMRGQGVGARRTCYFNAGYIEETVTAWNPPSLMGLSIDRTHMPGRHWLGFLQAEYRLQGTGQMVTVLTRSTTVTSQLYPAWYWRPFERLGVESEHRYILQDVASKAGR